MKSTTYSDTYQMVTERIIAKLEAGTIPWKHFALHPLQEPRNLVSKKPYQWTKSVPSSCLNTIRVQLSRFLK